MVKNPGVRKQREESLVNWMWLSSNPTPLSFFRYIDAVDRSRSINKYSSIITKAIKRNSNITISDKLNNALDKFNVCGLYLYFILFIFLALANFLPYS